MTVVEFEVEGRPMPQGSKTAVRHGDKARLINAGTNGPNGSRKALADWRAAVAAVAADIAADTGRFDGPIAIDVEFRMPMPKSRSKAWRQAGERPHTVKPDVDKLLRSLFDGLTDGGLILDDARIDMVRAQKIETTGWTGAWVEIAGPQ